jgi:hypothetical protein
MSGAAVPYANPGAVPSATAPVVFAASSNERSGNRAGPFPFETDTRYAVDALSRRPEDAS